MEDKFWILQQFNTDVLHLAVFPPNFMWKLERVMSCFYGKEGIVYGKVGLELVMSQSPCVDFDFSFINA